MRHWRGRQRRRRVEAQVTDREDFPDVPESGLEKKAWRTHSRGRFRDMEPITRLEARAAASSLVALARDPSNYHARHLHYVDSMAFALAAGKGRSSNKAINSVLRRIAALRCATGIFWRVRWIAGTRMPADSASRPRQFRPLYGPHRPGDPLCLPL